MRGRATITCIVAIIRPISYPQMLGHQFLQSEGISEEFFALIWSKDELNFGPSINIPDTVIFKNGTPTAWYFTATDGRIKRKNRQNLVSSKIEEVFTSHVLGYDILATFISFPVEPSPHSDEKPVSTIEYFDKQILYDFLYKQDKRKCGILQRFIEPKGTKNDIIRAIWSPKICLLERTENIYNLHDQRFGLYERCVTYEAPEYFSVSSSLRGAVLAGQIQRVCETVVSHVSEVTYGQKQISRVVMNLKVDSRDKLWLLFTTSIQCDNDTRGSNNESIGRTSQKSTNGKNLMNLDSVFSLPDVVNLNPLKSYEDISSRKPKMRLRCLSCSEETLDHTRHPVSYKSIVKHYEHVIRLLAENYVPHTRAGNKSMTSLSSRSVLINWPPDREVVVAAGGVGFGCLDLLKDDRSSNALKVTVVDINDDDNIHMIPPILRYLHPKLNSSSYERCRRDPLFLYKNVTVCESCFLVFADFTTMLLKMGQNISSFLKSDPSAAKITDNNSSIITRPSSADWRAMSSIHRHPLESNDGIQSGPSLIAFRPSENHVTAKSSAIGIRTSDKRRMPGMPIVIRRGDETASVHGPLSLNGLNTSSLYTATSQASSLSNIGEKENSIVEREKNFFREISMNPPLGSQHPLMHLITAQQRVREKKRNLQF